ncbi:histidine phosphatase family protein [Paenibacillus borealis]|uniref:Phosphoglycerate mutase n=1 Tax=Paenibacillus borealis TaxID=160799 RepID=A0A089LD06_PAEBO|nr:histidine phosphatase family protein [Paenibacillus borealis]AIQ57945.1 phosphoglycerate mutase [Paenibacillus borealis]
MAIYLVRHGKDDEGFRGGWSQRGLITQGYRQSEKLGRHLRDNQSLFNIQRIVSSDLQRALDTAGELARELEIPLERSMDWREMNNGVIAGMPNEIVNERFPGLYFSGLRMDECYPGGESPLEFFTRIKEAFARLCEDQADNNPEGNIMIVTHGGVINIIYHIIRGLDWNNRGSKFPASYTSMHTIEHQGGKWTISLENYTV